MLIDTCLRQAKAIVIAPPKSSEPQATNTHLVTSQKAALIILTGAECWVDDVTAHQPSDWPNLSKYEEPQTIPRVSLARLDAFREPPDAYCLPTSITPTLNPAPTGNQREE